MADNATKNDIKEIKDLVSAQTGVILGAVDERFGKIDKRIDEKFETMDAYFDKRFDKIESEMTAVRQSINELTLTLDNFIKRFTNYEEEITLIKARVDKMAEFLKEKFGVEISAQ